jgi:hypothetical protein
VDTVAVCHGDVSSVNTKTVEEPVSSKLVAEKMAPSVEERTLSLLMVLPYMWYLNETPMIPLYCPIGKISGESRYDMS